MISTLKPILIQKIKQIQLQQKVIIMKIIITSKSYLVVKISIHNNYNKMKITSNK